MKNFLSGILALTFLLSAGSAAFGATKKSSAPSQKRSSGKSRSGHQPNPGRQKTNIPKNPN